MKGWFKAVSMLVIPVILSGCMSTPVKEVAMEILSDPSGARIEVNDEYAGTTPCTVKIPANIKGEFTRRTIIRATPVADGQYPQTKIFSGGNEDMENDLVPKRILFNMNRQAGSR